MRVVIVDDHDLVREGLAALLGGLGMEVAGAAADGAQAAEVCARTAPDVVLMDLEMPGADGVEGTRRVLAASPRARVVVLTSVEDRARIGAALDAGACGWVLKGAGGEDLARAMRRATAGPVRPVAGTARAALAARGPEAAAELTEREREVLGLAAAGLANREIAARLGIGVRTVKGHLTSAFRTVGVADRRAAAAWATSGVLGAGRGRASGRP